MPEPLEDYREAARASDTLHSTRRDDRKARGEVELESDMRGGQGGAPTWRTSGLLNLIRLRHHYRFKFVSQVPMGDPPPI